MPTISLRISEKAKAKISSLAQETGGTISGVVLDAVNSAIGGGRENFPEDMAPSSLSSANRLILRNQELLLSMCPDLDEYERHDHDHNARILENGYTSEYSHVFTCLSPEVPYSLSEELFGILDMFRVLRASYESLSEEEKGEVEERYISLRGFDLSDSIESPLVGYVKYLFEDERYTELMEPLGRFSDGGNSHHPNLGMYRRMRRCFEPIWREHLLTVSMLSLEEIKKVVSAIPYNSGY